MIFQDPTACLNPVFTVGDQMTETLRVKRRARPRAARERAIELLAASASRRPSGGCGSTRTSSAAACASG